MQTMNNICQFSRHSAAPAPVVFVSPVLRTFAVSFRFAGELHEINVLAFTSCDATCSAIDMFFDGDEEMPVGGLEIKVSPINAVPRAA